MKRLLILTVALATMLALAAPVGAVKPDRPGKPGKSGPIDVTIDTNLLWANAPGDTIFYTIEVTSSEDISGAVVELSVNDEVAALFTVVLGPGPSLILEYPYIVATLPAEDIVASAAVLVDEEAMASDTLSVTAHPVDKCGFDETSLSMTHPGGVCWYDFAPGYWEVVAEPDYDFARRNPNMTMRDHVSGNWCMVGETETSEGSKTQPKFVTFYVYLPTANPFGFGEWYEVGVCGVGGHGVCTDEDCFFATGNPVNFVLAAPPGAVTATRLGDDPPATP